MEFQLAGEWSISCISFFLKRKKRTMPYPAFEIFKDAIYSLDAAISIFLNRRNVKGKKNVRDMNFRGQLYLTEAQALTNALTRREREKYFRKWPLIKKYLFEIHPGLYRNDEKELEKVRNLCLNIGLPIRLQRLRE